MAMTAILYDTMDALGNAELAGVVGTDGLSVEIVLSANSPYEDVEMLEMEVAGLASMVNATTTRLGTGPTLDLLIESDYLIYLLSLVTPGYYAVLAIPPDGNIAHARSTIRHMVARFQQEL